jgi:hypothetical protein
MFEYRPLASPANWVGFQIAKTDKSWHLPHLEFGSFLVLHSAHALHATVDLPAQSLEESWRENDEFFRLGRKSSVPPLVCCPIYLITVGVDAEEKVVYVGKTSSGSSRFAAGHRAMTLLHHPRFEGSRKRLYKCCIVFISVHKKEIPIEWVTPLAGAKLALAIFENVLIYHFQPELNTQLKGRPPNTSLASVHIQNVSGEGSFLNDTFIWP